MAHPTTVPSENTTRVEPEYDTSNHDQYMCSLRLDMIRRGVIQSNVDQ